MVKIAVTIELCEQPLIIIIINGTWCGKNGANNEKKNLFPGEAHSVHEEKKPFPPNNRCVSCCE